MSVGRELACVIHVHSTYSDGNATVPELLDDARANGRDVLVLTDHDTLGARVDGWEGWHDGVLLLVGHEVSPKGGHFLALGTEEVVPHEGATAEQIAARVAELGGVGIAAHPFSEGARMSRRIAPPHGWPALAAPGVDGVELWSLITDAAEDWHSPAEAVAFMRDPTAHIVGPSRARLRAWDRLCARRRCVAIGGLDAHQSGFRWRGRPRSPFPNRRFFGTLATHVLTERPARGELEADRALVLGAIRAGRCFLALDSLAPAHGFRYEGSGPHGRTVGMGEQVRAREIARVRATLPAPAEQLRLLCDGRLLASVAGDELEHPIPGPGSYRIEALRRFRGTLRSWIISNPIYVRA